MVNKRVTRGLLGVLSTPARAQGRALGQKEKVKRRKSKLASKAGVLTVPRAIYVFGFVVAGGVGTESLVYYS